MSTRNCYRNMYHCFKTIMLLMFATGFAFCRQAPKHTSEADTPTVAKDTPPRPVAPVPAAVTRVKKPAPATQVEKDTSQVEAIGNLILKDSLVPLDDEKLIYQLLDSLGAKKRSSRDFYFGVFNKLMKRSEGILADAVGNYALTYVENYPAEFLANSKSLSPTMLETWASQIGIELYLASGDAKDTFEKTRESFRQKCRECSKADLERLAEFEDMIWTTIQQNLGERAPN